MNLTVTNVAILTVAVALLSACVDLVKAGNWIGGLVCGVVGLVAVFLYEKLPPSTPS